MTSAAEQFASNINLASFAKAEELKKRLLFTLGALIVYRLGTFVPIPGIDPIAFSQGFQSQQGGLLGCTGSLLRDQLAAGIEQWAGP